MLSEQSWALEKGKHLEHIQHRQIKRIQKQTSWYNTLFVIWEIEEQHLPEDHMKEKVAVGTPSHVSDTSEDRDSTASLDNSSVKSPLLRITFSFN